MKNKDINEKQLEKLEQQKSDFEKLMQEIKPYMKQKRTHKAHENDTWISQEEISHFSLDKL